MRATEGARWVSDADHPPGEPRMIAFPRSTINFRLARSVAHNGPAGGFALARNVRSVGLTQVSEWDDGALRRKDDYLAAEEPLEIRVGDEPLSVTMRTRGTIWKLAAGFLFTEGLIQTHSQLIALEIATPRTRTAHKIWRRARGDQRKNGNVVQAQVSPDAAPDMEKMRRHFFAASSCGICGKASIDAIRARGLARAECGFPAGCRKFWVRLPEEVRAAQDVFEPHRGAARRSAYSMRAGANCWCCARTSAGTTPWIKYRLGAAGRSRTACGLTFCWLADAAGLKLCRKRLWRGFRWWRRYPRLRAWRCNWRANCG